MDATKRPSRFAALALAVGLGAWGAGCAPPVKRPPLPDAPEVSGPAGLRDALWIGRARDAGPQQRRYTARVREVEGADAQGFTGV